MSDKKALLVIDMQEACVGKNHAEFFKYDSNIVTKVNEEIKANDESLKDKDAAYFTSIVSKISPVSIPSAIYMVVMPVTG